MKRGVRGSGSQTQLCRTQSELSSDVGAAGDPECRLWCFRRAIRRTLVGFGACCILLALASVLAFGSGTLLTVYQVKGGNGKAYARVVNGFVEGMRRHPMFRIEEEIGEPGLAGVWGGGGDRLVGIFSEPPPSEESLMRKQVEGAGEGKEEEDVAAAKTRLSGKDDLGREDESDGSPREEGLSGKLKPEGGRGGEVGDERERLEARAEGKEERSSCPLGLLYVYNLPRKFNADLVTSCNVTNGDCIRLANMGLGPSLAEEGVAEEEAKAYRDMVGDLSSWYFTHMKGDWASSEPIYHARMAQHPCRTEDPEKATVFYLPYYVAMGLERVFSKKNSTLSNELPLAFTAWVAEQPYFQRNKGVDHFLAIGSGVWNLQQQKSSPQRCGLLDDPVTAKMTKMSHDKDPWDRTTAGIPYPVFFHPSTDDQIHSWKERVRSWPRKYRAAFIGSKSREGPSFAFSSWRFSFRTKLLDECEGWDQCKVLDCHYEGSGGVSKCHRPRFPLQLSMDSDFCFQPAGDTMPRKSTFDGMIAGCIPVFFDEDSGATQYFWYLPPNRSSYSVFIDYAEVEKEGADPFKFLKYVVKNLSSYTPEQITSMRNVILDDILPSLVTANPNDFHLNHFQDAASRAVEKMMIKVARFKAGVDHAFPNPYLLTANETYAYQLLELPAPHELPA